MLLYAITLARHAGMAMEADWHFVLRCMGRYQSSKPRQGTFTALHAYNAHANTVRR